MLLQAFFAEFGEDDDVLLLLRSKPPGGALAEFKAAFRDKKVFPYKFTAKKKRGIQARDALYKSGVKQIVDTINYYKSSSSTGRQYPDKLEFTDPVVNAEKMTITISTDNIDNGSKKIDD